MRSGIATNTNHLVTNVTNAVQNDIQVLPDIQGLPEAETTPAEFVWGEKEGDLFIREVNHAYNEIVYWRKNIFKLPSGAAGKLFIKESTRLLRAWNSKSAIRNTSIKCLMLMPALLLQKPSPKSKSKEHADILKRRLDQWSQGKISDLLYESQTIQRRLKSFIPTNSDEAISKKFAALMKSGNVNAAIKL